MFRISAPKPSGISPGAAKTGKAKVMIALAEDILSYPQRDAMGVRMIGNFVFKPGRGWQHIYMTPSRQDRSYETEGEEDAISVIQSFVGFHPGDELSSAEFVQQWLGQGVIIGVDFCDGSPKRIIGTPCAPLSIRPNFIANNEQTGYEITFQAFASTNFLPGFYFGDFIENEPFEVSDNTAIALSSANGNQYLLKDSAAGDAIAVASNDLPHGSIVSFIGQGGADPAELAGSANVLLINGTDWVALQNAVINFKVFNNGVSNILIEESRS